MRRLLLFCLGLFLVSSCGGNAGKERVDELTSTGVKVENERVTAWFPKDSVQDIRMKEIADSLQQIIIASEQMIGNQPWQQFKGKKDKLLFQRRQFCVCG
ncbi:hypothetical protein GU926_05255 [Nibribacter ruber]|uniref:Uncharacterized protein n=1 Tax=Nibribacter ruber TaxID=2698458 RepID=A0A6P1NY57_9BACT|nr:hypothetical protein [Nibribacter ruber]QHL86875.1 hypothetical protein GU926_05255 [Nibribacter ruber]